MATDSDTGSTAICASHGSSVDDVGEAEGTRPQERVASGQREWGCLVGEDGT